jgi:hypothetical protein
MAGGKRQMLLTIGAPQYPDSALSNKNAVQELTERTWEIMQRMMKEPVPTIELSPSLALRLACLFILARQVFHCFGVI